MLSVLKDGQVRELLRLVRGQTPLYVAARRVGTTEKTARRYVAAGKVPSQMKTPRTYRTREDPFETAWPEVLAMLEGAPDAETKTIFEALCEKHPGRWQEGQVRTLQRRLRDWRALHGPEREVFFTQLHHPGRCGQSDWTCMNELEITIGGVAFDHLLYHFVLPYSNWEYVEIARSESYAALSQGLQNALWALDGVPEQHRTDNTTAATHDLKREDGRAFNARYMGLVGYYGLEPTTNSPGNGNENGDVEKAHDLFKRAANEMLKLRRSREFASRSEYERFLRELAAKRNKRRTERLAEERPVLRPLPARRHDDVVELTVVVKRTSTITVMHNVYSLPARLIGHEVKVRVEAEELEVRYGTQVVERMPRLLGSKQHRINYRHLIRWLVRKPGAFENYRYRDELFPSLTFRRAFDTLRERVPGSATIEYLRVLLLAANTLESDVVTALELILDAGEVPTSRVVEELVAPRAPACPVVEVRDPDLASYDGLLTREEAA